MQIIKSVDEGLPATTVLTRGERCRQSLCCLPLLLTSMLAKRRARVTKSGSKKEGEGEGEAETRETSRL